MPTVIDLFVVVCVCVCVVSCAMSHGSASVTGEHDWRVAWSLFDYLSMRPQMLYGVVFLHSRVQRYLDERNQAGVDWEPNVGLRASAWVSEASDAAEQRVELVDKGLARTVSVEIATGQVESLQVGIFYPPFFTKKTQLVSLELMSDKSQSHVHDLLIEQLSHVVRIITVELFSALCPHVCVPFRVAVIAYAIHCCV
jgi:hypothetical protein